MKIILTQASETINPARNWFPSELKTHIIAEMITVLGD